MKTPRPPAAASPSRPNIHKNQNSCQWVVGDGTELWRSARPIVQAGQSEECRIPIKGVQKLELFVDCGGRSDYAHAVWVSPMLTGRGN